MYTKDQIVEIICNAISSKKEDLKFMYENSENTIGYFYIDNLLPEDLATEIFNCFPKPETTTFKKSLKENKYVSAQVDQHPKVIEDSIFAFQDSKVIKLITSITSINNLEPDPNLYAGGISMMGKNSFLNPHLDNSHDKDRIRYRAFNLLYYVTPNWHIENGGNLELWPNGTKNKQITIHAKFNRLVVMTTHKKSWHSVSKVTIDRFRCCLSNYYFNESPVDDQFNFHVTTFRGRPEQKFIDSILKIDNFIRMQVRKVFKKGIIENPQVYKHNKNQ